METGRAISAFWFHRLLCRVFANGNDRFVLKGGQGMLARTVDARATRDIDLLARGCDLGKAVAELEELANEDLGDHVRFSLSETRPIKTDDDYRSGAALSFEMWVGAKRMSPLSIDLVVDEVPLEGAEHLTPADRIDVQGIATCDYLVYPIEAALSDKLCGIMELHDGHASSRVKDLVDIAVYATAFRIDGSCLQERLQRELGARGVALPEGFVLPKEWLQNAYMRAYSKQAASTGLPKQYHDIQEASTLAKRLLNPALKGETKGKTWDIESLAWA